MPGKIHIDTAYLFGNLKVNNERLSSALGKLSSGTDQVRPGDDVVSYYRASRLGFEKSTEQAQLESLQTRLTWFQTSLGYLEGISSTLRELSALTIQAKSTNGVGVNTVLDESFQALKGQLSSWVDGLSGQASPAATFAGIPLFLGYEPNVQLGSQLADPEANQSAGINLFTNTATPGYNKVPFLSSGQVQNEISLTGTAQNTAVSTTQIILDNAAAAIPDVYKGRTISVTVGGVTTDAVITAYDYKTSTVTFQDIGFDVSGATYEVHSGVFNETIHSKNQVVDAGFSSFVWGADNYRVDWINGNPSFVAITEGERTYRDQQGISNTELLPQTFNEKIRRRELNIFDPEFGNLRNPENASRMFVQVNQALDQVALIITRHDAKSQNLQSQWQHWNNLKVGVQAGIDATAGLDYAKEGIQLNESILTNERIINIAGRLNQNLRLLTNLMGPR